MPRNLARADCTCKSQNEVCHIVTILIGERLAVLSVRRSTFHPAEGNSKAGKPTNCNVELWFVLDTCCTSSLRSTQLHIETQKKNYTQDRRLQLCSYSPQKLIPLALRPRKTTFKSTTHPQHYYQNCILAKKRFNQKRCGSRQWFSTLLNGRNLKDSSPKKAISNLA